MIPGISIRFYKVVEIPSDQQKYIELFSEVGNDEAEALKLSDTEWFDLPF